MPWLDVIGDVSGITNPAYVIGAGANYSLVPAGETLPTVILDSPAVLLGVVVRSVGLGAVTIFDNASTASGDAPYILPASAPIGFIPFPSMGISYKNGITIGGGATNPAITILWAQ